MAVLRAISIIAVLILSGGVAESQTSREYQVKAVFLLHFARFTEWPAEATPQADSPIVIGVMGEDPFGKALDAAVRDEVVHGRRIVVERYGALSDMKTCHILFISKSEAKRQDAILEKLQNKPVLTVADTRASSSHPMITFMVDHGRVRFKIDLPAVKAAHISLSSKLLRVAEVVEL